MLIYKKLYFVLQVVYYLVWHVLGYNTYNECLQVVIITDGLVDVTPEVQNKITSTNFPFPCDFHLFSLTAMNEIYNKDSVTHLNVSRLFKPGIFLLNKHCVNINQIPFTKMVLVLLLGFILLLLYYMFLIVKVLVFNKESTSR